MEIVSLSNYSKNCLEKKRQELAKKAGYGLLPSASKTTVKNVPNSSEYKEPNGNSCIGYWEEKASFDIKKDTIYYCPACNKAMSKKDSTLDGAHVYKLDNPYEWYFVPLCSTCNNSNNTKPFDVDTKLVPVPEECYEKKE